MDEPTAARHLPEEDEEVGASFRQLSGSAIGVAIVRVSGAVLGVGNIALLARVATPVVASFYVLLLVLGSYGALMGTLGAEQTVARRLPRLLKEGRLDTWAEVRASSLVVSVVGLGGTAAIVAFIVLPLVSPWAFTSTTGRLVVLVAACWVCLVGLQRLAAEFHRSEGRIVRASLAGGAIQGIVLASLLSMASVLGVPIGIEAALFLILLSGIGSLVTVLPGSGLGHAARGFVMARPLRFVSGSLATLAVFGTGHFLTEGIQVVGAALLRADELLQFGVMMRLAAFVSLPLTFITAATLPSIGRESAGGFSRDFRNQMGALTFLGLCLGGVAAALILFAGPHAMLALSQTDAVDRRSLAVLLVGNLAVLATGPCVPVMLVCGYIRPLVLVNVFAVVLTLSGSYFLIPPLGVLGVCTAVLLGLLFQNVMTLALAYRRTGFWTTPSSEAIAFLWRTLRGQATVHEVR